MKTHLILPDFLWEKIIETYLHPDIWRIVGLASKRFWWFILDICGRMEAYHYYKNGRLIMTPPHISEDYLFMMPKLYWYGIDTDMFFDKKHTNGAPNIHHMFSIALAYSWWPFVLQYHTVLIPSSDVRISHEKLQMTVRKRNISALKYILDRNRLHGAGSACLAKIACRSGWYEGLRMLIEKYQCMHDISIIEFYECTAEHKKCIDYIIQTLEYDAYDVSNHIFESGDNDLAFYIVEKYKCRISGFHIMISILSDKIGLTEKFLRHGCIMSYDAYSWNKKSRPWLRPLILRVLADMLTTDSPYAEPLLLALNEFYELDLEIAALL